jgi:hypothetical protein
MSLVFAWWVSFVAFFTFGFLFDPSILTRKLGPQVLLVATYFCYVAIFSEALKDMEKLVALLDFK